MTSKYNLGIVDYVVLAFHLLMAVSIGFKFSKVDSKKDFFLGTVSRLPVILSISVTMTSAVTMTSLPSELYKYGSQHLMHPVGTVLGMFIASYLLIPVYFQCEVSTVHEFLEIRYGKYTSCLMSGVFILQSIMYVSVALYYPALTLSSIIDLPLEAAILSIGIIVSFYCTLGGLKAVIWVDVLQALLMFACVGAFYAVAIEDAGGFSVVYDRTCKGKRFQLFNFSLDLTARYTFWNCFFQGVCTGIGYGTNQTEVQKLLSRKSKDLAKKTLQLSTIPLFIFHTLTNAAGLVLYALYYMCDPIMNKIQTGLTKYDQLVPYYLVSRFRSVPGLTGLCISGIFSDSLSGISSTLNSLATVSVMHCIKQSFLHSERNGVWLARALCAFYGVTCITLTYAISSAPVVAKMAYTVYSIQEGPLIAVLLIAALTTSASDKNVMMGLFISIPVVSWIAVGSMLGGYNEPYLEINTNNCPITSNFSFVFHESDKDSNISEEKSMRDTFVVYKISYTWIPVIGCFFTGISILVITKLYEFLGWNQDKKPVDIRCLSPVTRLWVKEATSSIQLQTQLQTVPTLVA